MGDDDIATGVVLDYLAHGRSEDDRPRYQREPVCYVIDPTDFQLYELIFGDQPDISIGESIQIEPVNEMSSIRERNMIPYDKLSAGARTELEYTVEDIIDEHEDRFIAFFNEAQPISLRLHQLNLLSGIGDKLRDNILDQRKRRPFEDFDDIGERVSGLHNPRAILIDRIMDELRDDSLKYYLFVGPDSLLVRQ